MINGRVEVGRFRQTAGEQSDSNKVNLPLIHLPGTVPPPPNAGALHTLTDVMLHMRGDDFLAV